MNANSNVINMTRFRHHLMMLMNLRSQKVNNENAQQVKQTLVTAALQAEEFKQDQIRDLQNLEALRKELDTMQEDMAVNAERHTIPERRLKKEITGELGRME